jgi:hypothetical protein
MQHFRYITLFLFVTGLAGCASMVPESESLVADPVRSTLQFETRSSLAGLVGDDVALLQSTVQAGQESNPFQYRARYEISSGQLLRSMGRSPGQPREMVTDLGRQMLSQQLRLTLPEALGVPIRVDFDNRRDFLFSVHGEQRTDSTRAHLNWEPEHFGVNVSWRPPRDMVQVDQPMDCYAHGQVRVPAPLSNLQVASSLDVSQQRCLIMAPHRGYDAISLDTQGIAWRWGKGLGSAVRVLHYQPQDQGHGVLEFEPGYEFGLVHRQILGHWQVAVDLALHKAGEVKAREVKAMEQRGQASSWAIDFLLSRDLDLLVLSARWMQARDPLWFLPVAQPLGSERLSVLVDFSQWLTQSLPKLDARMSASWEHYEVINGVDDNQFKWDFSLSW